MVATQLQVVVEVSANGPATEVALLAAHVVRKQVRMGGSWAGAVEASYLSSRPNSEVVWVVSRGN